jgi:hypothetical protein
MCALSFIEDQHEKLSVKTPQHRQDSGATQGTTAENRCPNCKMRAIFHIVLASYKLNHAPPDHTEPTQRMHLEIEI